MAKPKGLGAPIVMERGAKVACYGREGTGKTELVMSARHVGRLILLDTEGRSQYYDPTTGYGFEVKYSKSAEDALELLRYAEELHRQGQKSVFGIDSYSSLWFAQQEVAEQAGATRSGNAKFTSWGIAKRNLLKKLVVWVELEAERGNVAYTFPLRDADLYTVPPGEYEQQDRTVHCHSSREAANLSEGVEG